MNRHHRGVAAIVLAAVMAACGSPAPSVDFAGPCVVDGRAPGAYPDLEAKLPPLLGGDGPADGSGDATVAIAPTTVDSGRSCTPAALGTYTSHGFTEVRFAGATWSQDPVDATVIAVFTAPPSQPELDQTWVQEFYESGARASTKTENIEITMPQLGQGGRYWRLETLNNLSLQTVAVWGGDPGLVHVVIVATQVQPGASRSGHNDRVDLAIRAVLDTEGAAARTTGDPVLVSRP